MGRHFLLFFMILLCCAETVSAQISRINPNFINIQEYGPATRAKIRAIRNADRAADNVTIGQDLSQADFVAFCKDAPWVRRLEIGYACKHIESLEPLRGLKDLRSLKFSRMAKFQESPLDLGPLSGLKMVEWLQIDSTLVKNTDALSTLVNMKEMQLTDTGNPSLAFLRPMTKLESITILDKKQSVNDFKDFAELTNLKKFVVSAVEVTDQSTANLTRLTNLEWFQLSFPKGVTNVDFLKDCRKLRDLTIDRAPMFTDVSALKGMTNLRMLRINGTPVTDVSALAGSRSLEMVNLSGTQVSDVSPLAKCPALRTLSIEEAPVKDLTPLHNSENLAYLSCSGSIPQPQIDGLKRKLPKCRVSSR